MATLPQLAYTCSPCKCGTAPPPPMFAQRMQPDAVRVSRSHEHLFACHWCDTPPTEGISGRREERRLGSTPREPSDLDIGSRRAAEPSPAAGCSVVAIFGAAVTSASAAIAARTTTVLCGAHTYTLYTMHTRAAAHHATARTQPQRVPHSAPAPVRTVQVEDHGSGSENDIKSRHKISARVRRLNYGAAASGTTLDKQRGGRLRRLDTW